jgi:hypothetical protein
MNHDIFICVIIFIRIICGSDRLLSLPKYGSDRQAKHNKGAQDEKIYKHFR